MRLPILNTRYKIENSHTGYFQNYLSDCSQRVKHAGLYSDRGTVTGGVPQGSALGPLYTIFDLCQQHAFASLQ